MWLLLTMNWYRSLDSEWERCKRERETRDWRAHQPHNGIILLRNWAPIWYAIYTLHLYIDGPGRYFAHFSPFAYCFIFSTRGELMTALIVKNFWRAACVWLQWKERREWKNTTTSKSTRKFVSFIFFGCHCVLIPRSFYSLCTHKVNHCIRNESSFNHFNAVNCWFMHFLRSNSSLSPSQHTKHNLIFN